MIQSKLSKKGEITDYLSRMGDVLHNVTERDEVIITILTIHIVIDGDQAYTFLTKHLHDFANLEVVTTDSAHILDADRVDVTGIDLAHHGHEARTIKAGT